MTPPTRRICTSIFIAMCVVLTLRTGAAAQPLVDLNGDTLGDAFIYNGYGGAWAMETALPGGGFAQSTGTFDYSVHAFPANFNNDGLTDFFIWNWTAESHPQWFKMLNNGTGGFTAAGSGAWDGNFQSFVVDLNGDSVSDVFLWNMYTGVWFKCLSVAGGFTYTQGSWSTGWAVYPMRLNTDAMADFFISNLYTGQWFWVLGDAGPGFTYPQFAVWSSVWTFYRGDFSGDGLTDLFLLNVLNGQYFVATANPASGFTYVFGTFATGFLPYTLDLNADGRTDLFLYSWLTGQWFQVLSNGAGGLTVGGSGSFARNLWFFPSDFNADGRGDLLILDYQSGFQWFQAINLSLGSFSFAASGFWNTSAIQTRMTGREGLFSRPDVPRR